MLLEEAARGLLAIDHRVLHALLDDPERSLPGIVEFASRRESWEDVVFLEEDLILIAHHLRAPELVPFLMESLEVDPVDVEEPLQEAIWAHGPEVVEPLVDLFDRLENVHTTEVPFLLALLGVKDPRIEERLKKVAEADPDEGAFCLEIYGSPKSDENAEDPFDIWQEFPEQAWPDFEEMPEADLLQFLESPHSELRRQAVADLAPGYLAPKMVAGKLLDMARGDEDAWVRGYAWRALVFLELDEGLGEEMRDLLADQLTAPGERAGLAMGMAIVDPDEYVIQSILELYDLDETQTEALDAMWRTVDPVFSDVFLKHLDDPDPKRRENAIIGVGRLGIKSALGRLESMFESEFRAVALASYAMATPTKVTPAYIRRVFRKVEQLAGGLDPEETELVQMALDNRLRQHGQTPVFEVEGL